MSVFSFEFDFSANTKRLAEKRRFLLFILILYISPFYKIYFGRNSNKINFAIKIIKEAI